VLENAFDLLGGDIASAHAKDIRFGVKADFLAAGQGDLDFRRYLSLLLKSGYKGPLLMHGLSEDQVPSSKAFLEDILQELAETEKDEG
jgi:sugar phosphate isomerase/epimerase